MRSSACSSGRRSRRRSCKHERLGKPTALAVFASDNLSSVAYATEEILKVAVPAVGVLAFSLVMPVTFGILAVLAILLFSYRQTIKAYPSAGGAYIVTKDNFGLLTAQLAGVALLTDYVLTVSVSVAAGVAAITSAAPGLYPYRVVLSVAFIWIIAWGNLRGVRESGRLFAVPTYFFIVMMFVLLGTGMVRALAGDLHPLPVPPDVAETTGAIGLFLILHAFASGGAAVTGVEAISNGVPAFKPPEWLNARTTLMWMGSLLGVMFLGLSFLAMKLQVTPSETKTVISRGRAGDLRQRTGRDRDVPDAPGGDDADPDPGREHLVRRLPATGELPREGSLHASAAHQARDSGWCSPTASSVSRSPRPRS